jgi:hypothetical protein
VPFSERKIDQIEARLGSIENLLRDLSQRPISTPGSNVHFPTTPAQLSGVDTATASTVGFDSSDDESALGGDSVIAQQTTFASELLEHAVERTSLHDVSPKMWEALANLRQIAELQSRQSISHGPRFPLQQPLPKGGLGQLRMPPMDVVVSLLKRVKGICNGVNSSKYSLTQVQLLRRVSSPLCAISWESATSPTYAEWCTFPQRILLIPLSSSSTSDSITCSLSSTL